MVPLILGNHPSIDLNLLFIGAPKMVPLVLGTPPKMGGSRSLEIRSARAGNLAWHPPNLENDMSYSLDSLKGVIWGIIGGPDFGNLNRG